MERNLTTGSVLKSIVAFSAPYIISYFLQTLYGMADLFIAGQFNGVDCITAVTIGSQAMHMLTVMIVGLAMGSTVAIGMAIGAGKSRQAAEAVGNTVTLFMGVAVAAMILLLMSVSFIVEALSTPVEAVESTKSYLTICFIGIPFITAYNIISSVLRGMGDSKSPMYFIAVACLVNIVLDYFFMGVMGLGAAGAALGTTLAQTVSVITSLIFLTKQRGGIKLRRSDFKLKKNVFGGIVRVGIPVALQDGFIQIAFMVITVIANRRGLNDAAAVGIVEKIIGMVFIVPSSMLSAVSAVSAQNFGAGKPERAVLTLKYAIAMSVGYGFAVGVIVQFFAGDIVGIFADDSRVILLGSQYIHSYIWDCMLAGIHFCFSGYFCALGRSGISFIHNFLSIVLMRIPGAYIASEVFTDTLLPMGAAAPAGSLLSAIICLIAFFIINGKEKVTA